MGLPSYQPRTSDQTLRDAIDLFVASKTSKLGLGEEVRRTLRSFLASEKIEYKPDNLMDGAGGKTTGDSVFSTRIWVHEQYKFDVAATSLMLAHEGVHAARGLNLDGEWAAWDLQCEYYQELLGPGVSPAGVRYPLHPSADTARWDKALQARGQDRLIDWILTNKTYAQGLSPGWIAKNLHGWGGIGNRMADTLLLYIRILADAGGEHVGLILDILEGTKSTPSRTQQLVSKVGGTRWRQVQSQMAVRNPGILMRLAKLQQETGIRL